ncbi:hypothetical protein IVB05_17430 [Bradyrhizobium sp. 170]|nr:hypothetical protein IVB05_17430 [Bradyrhizobium sp. 170]
MSSLSAPRATIISAPSANSRCSALASSQGARIQTFALFVGRQDHRHRLRVDRLADPTESATGKGLSPPGDEQLRSQKRAAGVRRPKSWEEYAEEQKQLPRNRNLNMAGNCFRPSSFKQENGCWIVSSEPRP